MNYKWEILGIESPDGNLITQAKYKASLIDDETIIETEGNWWFNDLSIKTPYDKVTEEMVISWIKQETTQNDVNSVESRLKEQFDSLSAANTVVAPWLPQVFTPTN